MTKIIRKLIALITVFCTLSFISGCADDPLTKFQHQQTSLISQLEQRDVQVVHIGNRIIMVLPTDTFFEPLSYTVNKYNQYTLQIIAELIYNYGNMPVMITAYSDTVGPRKKQIKYTQEQANVISAYLWSHGIVDQNLQIVAGAWKNTVASNLTPNGSGYNRRIEISFEYN